MGPMKHFSINDWVFVPTSENVVKVDIEEIEVVDTSDDFYIE